MGIGCIIIVKYDNAPIQHPYGSSQTVYPQAGNQPDYGAHHQYGKPPAYGMPPPRSYGPPRPGQSQPGEMAYQGVIQSSQTYGPHVPPQQQYPYPANRPVQRSYPPYEPADGYNQAAPVCYALGGQPVPAYGQASRQQAAGYAQGATADYGTYPSPQQDYPEQPVTNNTGYGYQAPQDPSYVSGAAPTSAATTGQHY